MQKYTKSETMAPKKPIADLTANPSATGYLFRSKAQRKLFIKEPEWNITRDSIEMNAIVHERANAVTNEQQQKMREQAKINGKLNAKRIEKIRKMQQNLREKFIESNEFIRECNDKELCAQKRIDNETELQKQLQDDIDAVTKKTGDLRKFHDELKSAIAELKPYEEVLDQVVDEMELFTSKRDLLDRCDAILLAHAEVTQNDQMHLRLIKEMQADMVKMSNEAMLIIAGLDNQLSSIQKTYDIAKAECLKWEGVLAPTRDIITDKEKSAFMYLDQIQQLYLLLCKRNNAEPKLRRDQIEAQLDFIKNEIETIQEIFEVSQEMIAIENRSDIAEYGSGKTGKPRK